MKYKALTLTQPWATLVAIGAKKIETRSWETLYRGPLLIHAAAGLSAIGGKRAFWQIQESQPFMSVLRAADLPNFERYPEGYPFGAIVASCELIDCVPTEYVRSVKIVRPVQACGAEWCWTANEQAFGDYSPGRFAWLLADVRPLAEPIPAKGMLGLWNWEGEL